MAILSNPGSPAPERSTGRPSRPRPTGDSALRRATSSAGAHRVQAGARSTATVVKNALNAPLASFYLVVASAGLLIALGVMMVLSASSVYAYLNFDGDSYFFVKRQVVFCVMGLIGAVILARLKPERLRQYAWVAAGLAFLLLILTYIPGLQANVNGNSNWLRIGGVQIGQPSEFAKLAMIIWCADILARKERMLDEPRHLLIPFLPVAGTMVLLVIFQGDMGTATIMAGILAGILWVVGTPVKVLGGLGLAGLAGLAVMTLSRPSRMRRLMAFLNPATDVQGANMQATVGVFALATGGWWGVGLGASRQKWGSLPEAHTDFVFAVIGEELGLIGSLMVLMLFITLGYAGFRIAMRSDNMFTRITAAGVTTWLTFQALVNLGVVLRLLPVMGVPLPMVSYGGSALLANMLALGVLIACARDEPAARKLLAKRKRTRTPQPKMTTVVGSRRG